MHATRAIKNIGRNHHNVSLSPVPVCPHVMLIGSQFTSPNLGVESVRGINASRTHGTKGNQLVFQRVVVRWWLEPAARWWCRNGICRIILVFASPGARASATSTSGKAGKKKLIFFSNVATICNVSLPTVTCTFSFARIWKNVPAFSPLYSTVPFHQPQIRQTNATYTGATDRILRVYHSHDKHGVGSPAPL
jgi:hypothetical protein